MPRGDRRGPAGMGPRTGRGAGLCSGYQVPGFLNRFFGGWMGRNRPWNSSANQYYQYYAAGNQTEQSVDLLDQLRSIREQLNSIERRIKGS